MQTSTLARPAVKSELTTTTERIACQTVYDEWFNYISFACSGDTVIVVAYGYYQTPQRIDVQQWVIDTARQQSGRQTVFILDGADRT